MCCIARVALLVVLAYRHVTRLVRFVMSRPSITQEDFWNQRGSCTVNIYPVTLRREQELQRSQAGRHQTLKNRRDHFLQEYDLDEADQP